MAERRLRLWRLTAILISGAALWGLGAGRGDYYEGETPPLEAGQAKARLDGGQMLGLETGARPNELSRLTLGFRLDFKSARPDLLGRLPGLGPASVAAGRERGYLFDYQSRRAEGLLKNFKNPVDGNDEPRSAPDDL